MMNKTVFVTGATGVLGKRVVSQFATKGYTVNCLASSEKKADFIRSIGGNPWIGNIYDLNRMKELTKGADAIFHLATRIPRKAMPKKSDWKENDRLRTEATFNLMKCCRINGIQKIFIPSVIFVYGNRDGNPVNDESPLAPEIGKMLETAVEMETIAKSEASQDIHYTILRYGIFYSHDSFHTVQMIEDAEKGKLPMLGDGSFYMNAIHVDDAAAAMVYAYEHFDRFKDKTTNVTDFMPFTYKDLATAVMDAAGAHKKPMKIPFWLARLIMGKDKYNYVTASFKVEKGSLWKDWSPKHQSLQVALKEIYLELKKARR